jgi:hypothetical protein
LKVNILKGFHKKVLAKLAKNFGIIQNSMPPNIPLELMGGSGTPSAPAEILEL